MKLAFPVVVCLLLSSGCFAQSTTWKLDNLKKIGGHKVAVLGQPKVITTEQGKAIEFDGVDDGIFIETNPLAGAKAFTVPAGQRRTSGAALAAR